MKISSSTHFTGPNVHSQGPALRLAIADISDLPAYYFDPAFVAELIEALPGLSSHWLTCTEAPTLEGDPSAVTHLFEHVCVELLSQAGCEAECVRDLRGTPEQTEHAILTCEDEEIGLAAAKLACDLFDSQLPAELPSEDRKPRFVLSRRIKRLARLASRTMLPIQDRELVRRARARDVPTMRLSGRIVQLGQGRYQQRVSATKTSHTNVVGNDLAANKDYARRVLTDLGLPSPRYERVYDVKEAIAAAKRIGYPVVVKPNNGSMGSAVSVGMKNRREVRAAYKRASKVGKSILVEEMVPGNDFRMLVVDGKLLAASHRIPGRLFGDGTSTVEELVERYNSDPRRGSGPRSSWTEIARDEQAERLLADVGYNWRSVPAKDEVVYLRRNANTSDGGTAVDVTDIVHPDNREIAERAARAIGLDIAGVDFLTEDISVSMWKSGGRICEVNSRPGLRKHIWPHEGTPRDVSTPIVNMLFPPGRKARIPIVAITGTGELGMTARMLAHILEADGHHVGLATRHRVYSGGRRIGRSRLTAPAAARMIALDPEVDVAVLEVTPDDVLRHGLGCDAIDVTLIINEVNKEGGAAEALPNEVIDALRVVARTTRDLVVLDGNDTLCGHALALDSGSATLCPLISNEGSESSTDREVIGDRRMVFDGTTLRDHVAGTIRGAVVLASAQLQGGADEKDSTPSALFACGAALALGKQPEQIYESLAGFETLRMVRAPRRRRSKAARSVQAPASATEEAKG